MFTHTDLSSLKFKLCLFNYKTRNVSEETQILSLFITDKHVWFLLIFLEKKWMVR